MSKDDRPAYWREHVAANQGGARIDFNDWPNFHGALRVQRLENFRLGDFQNVDFVSTAISYERTAAEIDADGDRSTRLLIPRSGVLGVEQHGRRVRLRPGQMGVIDWGQRMVLSHGDNAHAWILNVPADSLRLGPGGPPHLELDSTDPLPGSVLVLAEQLSRLGDKLTPDQFLRISMHWAGLLAAALDERRVAEESKFAAISRDARLHIQRYSDDPRLTVDAVARHLGISRRQLERAMRDFGASPHTYLLATRLERAVNRLTDARNSGRRIADIAYDSGFVALSAFNRACRDKYGTSPGRLRQRGLSSVSSR
ncbi:helix-turn-helix domain-containing protein [Nocardia concava]|uniref:helix-turn-helix domain-containing protein n=1 Tax=Nocardia concava TaxID=257281 RepID=UPI0012F9D857|nr:helix-turn-helix domain-containing protein [Nocardia concava]